MQVTAILGVVTG